LINSSLNLVNCRPGHMRNVTETFVIHIVDVSFESRLVKIATRARNKISSEIIVRAMSQ